MALLAAVNRFKFLKPVTPGQELRVETKKLTEVGQMACIGGTVWVDGRDGSERRVVGGIG